jgi:hypothetical protein
VTVAPQLDNGFCPPHGNIVLPLLRWSAHQSKRPANNNTSKVLVMPRNNVRFENVNKL